MYTKLIKLLKFASEGIYSSEERRRRELQFFRVRTEGKSGMI